MYAYFKRLDYFSTGGGVRGGHLGEEEGCTGGLPATQPPADARQALPCCPPPPPRGHTQTHPECVYAPFAARGLAREFVKDLEVGVCGRVG